MATGARDDVSINTNLCFQGFSQSIFLIHRSSYQSLSTGGSRKKSLMNFSTLVVFGGFTISEFVGITISCILGIYH